MTGQPMETNLHTAVWTGSDMIVWGGFDLTNSLVNSGGIYNPATDSWSLTSLAGAPPPAQHAQGVCMIIHSGHVKRRPPGRACTVQLRPGLQQTDNQLDVSSPTDNISSPFSSCCLPTDLAAVVSLSPSCVGVMSKFAPACAQPFL